MVQMIDVKGATIMVHSGWVMVLQLLILEWSMIINQRFMVDSTVDDKF